MLSADRLLKAAEVAKMSPETEVAAKECIVVSGGDQVCYQEQGRRRGGEEPRRRGTPGNKTGSEGGWGRGGGGV